MSKVPADIKKDRTAWAAQHVRCWLCERDSCDLWLPNKLETHEICRCSHSSKAWHRCNYFRACTRCHSGPLAAKDEMPHALQLAYKLLNDHDNFDLAAWHVIAGRPTTYVTREEVDLCIKAMRSVEIGR